MATIDEIKQGAEAMKNATQVGENTAVRVGGMFGDLADVVDTKANAEDVTTSLTNVSSRIDTLESKDIVLSESAYDDLSKKDETKFYFIYEE